MTDTAGPAVVTLLRQQWAEAEIQTRMFPDDEDAIVEELRRLCEGGAALALTVGGTGLVPAQPTDERSVARWVPLSRAQLHPPDDAPFRTASD